MPNMSKNAVMPLERIVASIKYGNSRRKPVLIAIDGFGGSGKTTFAEKLQAALGDAYVINIDDFIVKEKLLEPSWDKGSFDRKRLEVQVLKPAASDKPIAYQKLMWTENHLSDPVAVPRITHLIVEGISSLHPDIAHYFDYKIWIDTPIGVAKARGHFRDGSNENAQHWDLWTANDLRYQEKYHPEQHADFVVDNS